MADIKLLHVSAPDSHLQRFFQIKGMQAQIIVLELYSFNVKIP